MVGEAISISLAAARVNANMTQDDVAKALHVSNKTVGNWETGKVIPSFAVLNTLSGLYGIPMDNISLPRKSTLSEGGEQ